MADKLPDQLRQIANVLARDDCPAPYHMISDCLDAAAEIQRLRAELAALQQPATEEELVEVAVRAACDAISLDPGGCAFPKCGGICTKASGDVGHVRATRAVLAAVAPRIRARALEDAAKLIEDGKEYDGADLTDTLERLQYAHEWMRNQQRDALATAIRKLGPAIRGGADDADPR